MKFLYSIFSQSLVLYTLLFSMIFVNLYFFPNVLDNKDIRINDLSYLLPPKVNVVNSNIPIVIPEAVESSKDSKHLKLN